MNNKGLALIAPLQWGLGHTTRCIPLIHQLKLGGYQPLIASSGNSLMLLKQEFPEEQFINWPSPMITYGKSRWGTMAALFKQSLNYSVWIRQEQIRLQQVIKEYPIQLIVSDSRYGLHHGEIKSRLITHQLNLPFPIAQNALNRLYEQQLKPFHEIVVPDYSEDEKSLAGKLSRNARNDSRVKYCGPLSYVKPQGAETNKHLLVVLSGPEPQRSIFEDILLQQFKKTAFDFPVQWIRGTTSPLKTKLPDGITPHDLCTPSELSQLILSSRGIISRSGYTTIMDAHVARKPLFMVPTPGQWEQEYLAKHLMNRPEFSTAKQDAFKLSDALVSLGILD
jgi:uncharacterized protein (TIGR00661 family)